MISGFLILISRLKRLHFLNKITILKNEVKKGGKINVSFITCCC